MTTPAPPPPLLGESDAQELLRIALVYGKEWLRSGRKPPGAPHRPSLLAPSAAWLRVRTAIITRDAVQLAAARPLWETIAQLVVRIISEHPSPTLEQVATARFEAIVLGTPEPLAIDHTDGLLPSTTHLAVAPADAADRAVLIPAADAVASKLRRADHLAACCRRVGLAEDAWGTDAVLVYAFDAPLFST